MIKIEERGSHMDHMLNQTRQHHMQLSSMADMKANILLTMASVVTTFAFRYISDPLLREGTIILIIFSLITICLATFVVMPHVNFALRPGRHPNLEDPAFNILFFGDFSHLDFDEYSRGMEKMLNSPSSVYYSQIREIYMLGIFLARKKFRFLRMAYISFITGFLSSTILILFKTLMMKVLI